MGAVTLKEEKARAEAASSRADDVLLRCRNKHNHLSYERLREELRLPYSSLKDPTRPVGSTLARRVQGEALGGDCPQGGDMYDAPAQGSPFEGSRAQPLPEALISAPQAKKFWR